MAPLKAETPKIGLKKADIPFWQRPLFFIPLTYVSLNLIAVYFTKFYDICEGAICIGPGKDLFFLLNFIPITMARGIRSTSPALLLFLLLLTMVFYFSLGALMEVVFGPALLGGFDYSGVPRDKKKRA